MGEEEQCMTRGMDLKLAIQQENRTHMDVSFDLFSSVRILQGIDCMMILIIGR